jgi:hypothetical protein
VYNDQVPFQAAHLNQRISTLDEELRCLTETKVRSCDGALNARDGVWGFVCLMLCESLPLQARLDGDHRELQMRCTHAEADLSNLRSECERLRYSRPCYP